jgi:hypothetical protein
LFGTDDAAEQPLHVIERNHGMSLAQPNQVIQHVRRASMLVMRQLMGVEAPLGVDDLQEDAQQQPHLAMQAHAQAQALADSIAASNNQGGNSLNAHGMPYAMRPSLGLYPGAISGGLYSLNNPHQVSGGLYSQHTSFQSSGGLFMRASGGLYGTDPAAIYEPPDDSEFDEQGGKEGSITPMAGWWQNRRKFKSRTFCCSLFRDGCIAKCCSNLSWCISSLIW